MCGIAGWTTGPGAAPDEGALAAMVEALAHRNADGEGVCAAIDRSARREVVLAASLTDEASRISLALDGSILNSAVLRSQLSRRGYSFSGTSDAEVLLRAYQHWDKDVVKQLRGGFAFAVWDARKERLMLARDRFGQKPLYLHEAGTALYFASELKALLKVPGLRTDVDLGAVSDYLTLRYVPGPRTLVAGVRKLSPGTYALWQFGRLREITYWSPPDKETHSGKAPLQPVEGFIEKLDEAVKLHMDSDRPVGAFLSGGYDSAAIVALMKRHSERVETFSAGFAEDPHSELAAAAQAAKHFGTRHHEIVLAQRELLARLPELVASRDAPFSRPADVALHLLAVQAARNVKVALSGDGGDEILAGYRRHTMLRSFPHGHRKVNGLFVIPIENRTQIETPTRASPLRRILYYEQVSWLPDNLLERSDRMTMAASLELRTPFLDHPVAEYVSGLPDALRVRGLTTKWILRQAHRRLVPDGALKARKAGLRISLANMLRGEMRDLLLDHLRGPGCVTRAYYDAPTLDRLLDEHLAVRRNHEELLWTLLNLEIWHRTHLANARRG